MVDFLLDNDISEIVERLGPVSQAFSGKRILITGGRGFLGRYFSAVFACLNETRFVPHGMEPCEVVVLDNLITAGDHGSSIPEIDHFTFVQHDIVCPYYDKVDFILHAAGIASPYYYRKYPLQTLDVATDGLRNMLDLAVENKARIAFFSSSEIYGDPDSKNVPTKESYRGNVSSLGPRSCYDESKRLGETLVHIYRNEFEVAGTIIRPFNVYGPGMQKNDYRVLPNFFARLMENKSLQVYGDGNQTRTFCYVTDAIVGFLLVLLHGAPGEPYNIGNPTPEISMKGLAEEIGCVIGKRVEFDLVGYPETYPADEPNRRCPDIQKAISHLGYAPRVTLRDGLSRFYNWANDAYRDAG